MKKKIDIEEMSAQHQFTWNVLTTLDDGQRILGADLQQRAGVKDIRTMFQIIKDLRHNGYLVGGDKSGEKGYYEVRDKRDFERTIRGLEVPALDLLNTAELMKQYFAASDLADPEEEESDDE